jgi:hypothetical protein
MEKMERKGFQRTHADSCLLKRINQDGTVVICVYVDECLITGDRTAFDSAMMDIESLFGTRRLGRLTEYIGCSFMNVADGSMRLIQPDMIKKLEEVFGESVSETRETQIQWDGTSIERPEDEEVRLDQQQQKEFRDGVGMLLFLVKQSRTDISNAVRELSKVMDGATHDHMKTLRRVIKSVLTTKKRGVRMKPTSENGVVAYVDSDYAGDKGNRRSITGYLVYLNGVPIAWKSKQQGVVTLSSSEAEYYAISEVATELKFLKMILDFLETDSPGCMKVYVDNIGAIHLDNNASSGMRTNI